ncbi:hypothetical protein ACFSJ3_13560 [Corallincola platygyrae]|uniref:Sel1 repeat family protein n=1 Tax=Corallincola platygyrae TaxID=1193278 RepID=A0ABW4XRV8_9GAMM
MKWMFAAFTLVFASFASANSAPLSCTAVIDSCLENNQLQIEQEVPEALYWMAKYTFRQHQDFSLAYPWYLRAAKQGHAPAIRSLALYQLRGVAGEEQSYQKAFELLEQAKQLGDAKSYFISLKLEQQMGDRAQRLVALSGQQQ